MVSDSPNVSTPLQTAIHFLKKDELYQTQKPYSLRFVPPEGFARSNISLERHDDITIEDIRPSLDENSFDTIGFGIMHLQTSMSYDDFSDETKVKQVYLREVADTLRDTLRAKHVHIFEHTIRKRHPIFPISTGQSYEWNQPTSMAHIDTTVGWARDMVHKLNGSSAADLLKHRIQCVNVWKPLKGPVEDWPLALCDPRTIDASEDLESADLVYHDYVVENRQVYWTPAQRWYYLSNQQTDEAWIFRQSDSDPGYKVGVPHSSFANPQSRPEAEPRESIEVRALVYYGGDF